MKKTAHWHIGAFVFTVLCGTLLHFLYEWTGYSLTAALISPINESVWEHTKLGVVPIFAFALLEYLFGGFSGKKLMVAKTTAAYVFIFCIIGGYYFYTALLGRHFLAVDILLFIVAAAAAQYVSYRIMTSGVNLGKYYHVAFFACVLLLLAYIAFTFDPPRTGPFLDSQTNTYGLFRKPVHG